MSLVGTGPAGVSRLAFGASVARRAATAAVGVRLRWIDRKSLKIEPVPASQGVAVDVGEPENDQHHDAASLVELAAVWGYVRSLSFFLFFYFFFIFFLFFLCV